MFSTLDSCSVIAILPKSSPAIFSLIKFLAYPSGNKFYRIGNNITPITSNHDKMDVVRSNRIIQYHQTVALPGFIKPLESSLAILGKLEQELSLMASVINVPDLARDIVSFRSRHRFL